MSSLLKLLSTNPQALVLLLFLLVPGYVGIKFFDNLLPGRRRGFAQQIIDIVCWSFAILALWMIPALIVFGLYQRIPLWLSYLLLFVLLFGGLFATPTLIAYVIYSLDKRGALKNIGTPPPQTSWDWFFSNRAGNHYYVRFHLKEGTQFGGYFGENSFATSSPSAPEIYVEEIWRLDEDGRFVERVEETGGAMVNREDCTRMEFFKSRKSRDGETLEEGPTELGIPASDTNPKSLGG